MRTHKPHKRSSRLGTLDILVGWLAGLVALRWFYRNRQKFFSCPRCGMPEKEYP